MKFVVVTRGKKVDSKHKNNPSPFFVSIRSCSRMRESRGQTRLFRLTGQFRAFLLNDALLPRRLSMLYEQIGRSEIK